MKSLMDLTLLMAEVRMILYTQGVFLPDNEENYNAIFVQPSLYSIVHALSG